MHALGGSSTDRARTKVTFSSALARLSWPTIADGTLTKAPRPHRAPTKERGQQLRSCCFPCLRHCTPRSNCCSPAKGQQPQAQKHDDPAKLFGFKKEKRSLVRLVLLLKHDCFPIFYPNTSPPRLCLWGGVGAGRGGEKKRKMAIQFFDNILVSTVAFMQRVGGKTAATGTLNYDAVICTRPTLLKEIVLMPDVIGSDENKNSL